MPRADRFTATPILLIGVFAFSTIFAPVPLWATGFDKFDKMPATVQAEYVAVMVDTTQKALRDSGRADFADQIEQLFTKVEPGDSMSLGLVELESNIARARLADAQNLQKDPNTTRRIAVEDALFVTLEKNKMPMTTPVMNAVLDAMDKFHAQTYAEFENKSPTEQRNNIALLAKLGYPDSVFRDEIEARLAKKEPTFHDPDLRKQMVDLVAQQFPIGSSDQPGFAPVARDIAGEYAKTPDKAGVLYSLVIYVLTQLSAQLDARDKELDARSVVLPDGRHVFPDKDGVFWLYVNDKPTKLEDNLQPLAERLGKCKESRGISNGEQALAACKDEVGITDSASQGPAPEPTKPSATQVTVAPPPPSAPSAPASDTSTTPAAPADDDPFGGGGVITPPTVYNVLLCVEQPLVDRQSWNAPAAGGKMDLFKSAVARYITSIAKPDWQYWIGERQFDNFNPQANAAGDTLISRAAENPDPFNPSCPSGYPAYWLKVQH